MASKIFTVEKNVEKNTLQQKLREMDERPVENEKTIIFDKIKKCKLCGKEISVEDEYCHACLWKTRWSNKLLKSSKLASRRKRSHDLNMISIDREKARASFLSKSSDERLGGNIYDTTLTFCTCKDFANGNYERPCKHIFRLAEELGLFQNEHFLPGEDDYTLNINAANEYTEFNIIEKTSNQEQTLSKIKPEDKKKSKKVEWICTLIFFVLFMYFMISTDGGKNVNNKNNIITTNIQKTSEDLVISLTSNDNKTESVDVVEVSEFSDNKNELTPQQKKEKAEKLKKEQQKYLKEANTVVVTPRGKKYHYSDCRTVRGSYRTLTIKQARKKGYKPCGVCSPPDHEITLENCNIYWGDDVYGK